MRHYLLRRTVLYAGTVIGILIVTLTAIQGVLGDPTAHYSEKELSEAVRESLRQRMNIHKPIILNFEELRSGRWRGLLDSQLVDVICFKLPNSLRLEEPVASTILRRSLPSLTIHVPALLIGTYLQLLAGCSIASRTSNLARPGLLVVAAFAGVPTLSIAIGVQWVFAVAIQQFPVAGWEGNWPSCLRYAILPIFVIIASHFASGALLYRHAFAEAFESDYVRTAHSKGVNWRGIVLIHMLRNVAGMAVTRTVATFPAIVFGGAIVETVYQIPGLGSFFVDSVIANDVPAVIGMVYVLAIAHVGLLFVTDVLYAAIDPRIDFQ